MKDIRKQTGLSQQQLADYLGVPRSQVALAESNHRSLSGKALLKINPMYTALQSKQPVPQVEKDMAEQTASLNHKLAERKEQAAYLAMKAKRKLADIKTQYAQCSNALLMVNELRSKLTGTGLEAEQNKLSLINIELDALKKMKGCGVEAQGLLEAYIEGLEGIHKISNHG